METSRTTHKPAPAARTARPAAGVPAAAPGQLDFGPQNALGNRALETLLRTRQLQTKRTVSQPGDPWEREADRVASSIVAGSSPPAVQRACTCSAGQSCDSCEEEKSESLPVHRKAHGEASTASTPEARHALLPSHGEPLDGATRGFFEPRFGRDFADVRVHAGSEAAESARALAADAFTIGSQIGFAPGRYSPQTESGKRLLAHELTHVIQQDRNAGESVVHRQATVGEREEEPELAWEGPIVLRGLEPPDDTFLGPLAAGTVIREGELTITQYTPERVIIEYGQSWVEIRTPAGGKYTFIVDPERRAVEQEESAFPLINLAEKVLPPRQRVIRVTATAAVTVHPHLIEAPTDPDQAPIPQLVVRERYAAAADIDPGIVSAFEFLTEVREVPLGNGVCQLDLDRSAVRIVPPQANPALDIRDYPNARYAYWIDPLWSGPDMRERIVTIVGSPGVAIEPGTLEHVPEEAGFRRTLMPDFIRVPHPKLVPEQGEPIDAAQFFGAQAIVPDDAGFELQFGGVASAVSPRDVLQVATAHTGVSIAHPYSGAVITLRPTQPSIGGAYAWQVLPSEGGHMAEFRIIVGPSIHVDMEEPLPQRLRVEGGAPTPGKGKVGLGEGLSEEGIQLYLVQMPSDDLVPALGTPLNIQYYLGIGGWLRDPDQHRWLGINDLPYELTMTAVDIGIGMIPIIGDLVDIGEFVGALVTGKDRWGREVGTFDKVLMGVGAVIGLIPFLGGIGALLRGGVRATMKIADAARALRKTPEQLEVIIMRVRKSVSGKDAQVLDRALHSMSEGGEMAIEDLEHLQRVVSRLGPADLARRARRGTSIAAELVHAGEEGARPVLEFATEASVWRRGLNAQTRRFLLDNPGLARAYDEMPSEVRSVLTRCASLCVLPGRPTAQQIKRVEEIEHLLKPTGDELELLRAHFRLHPGGLQGGIDALSRYTTKGSLRRALRRKVDAVDAVLLPKAAWRESAELRAAAQRLLDGGMPVEKLAAIMRSAERATEGGRRMLHYAEQLRILERKGIQGAGDALNQLATGHGIFTGEEWVLRFIDRRNLWKKVEQLEQWADLTQSRRWDARIAGVVYQFKSWNQFYDRTFVKQIVEDFNKTNGLKKPLLWVFDPHTSIGSVDDIIAQATQALEDGLRKSRSGLTRPMVDAIKARLPDIIVLPNKADVGRMGTVIP
jgi:hypothetical protein